MDAIRQRVYNGKLQAPSVKVRHGGRLLKKGSDYALSYRNHRGPGKASVLVRGIGAYRGTKTVSFYISPKAPRIRRMKARKGVLALGWKRPKGATGFQVSCSGNRRFKGAKNYASSGSSKTVRNLSSGKKYYVRVRTCKKCGSRKVYGPYGPVREIRAS